MYSKAKHLCSTSILGSMVILCSNYEMLKKTAYCFTAPPTKDRIRGEYENKIRRMSPPEKIFEVFAMHKKGKNFYMSHSDLFLAICPYNYTTKPRDFSHEHDEEEEKEEFKSSALIEFADTDKDGLISLYEFYLVVDFMQTTTQQLIEFFGSLTERDVTKEEFKRFLVFIKHQKKDKLTISKYLPDPRKQHLSQEEFEQVDDQITHNLFQNAETIPLSKIVNLRERLYDEIYSYEFNSFELDESGNMKGEDFAKSIICYLDPSLVPRYWRKLNDIEWHGTVSLNQYVAFQKFLRENLNVLQERIEEKGVISRKKLKDIIKNYCTEQKANITREQLEIFLQVIDVNGNGRIDHDELVGVIQQRFFYGAGESHQNLEKPFHVMKAKAEVYWKKLIKIYEILQE